MITESMSIIRDENQEWLHIPLPGAEGAFKAGETAFEDLGNDHTPCSDTGADLFIVFDGSDGRYLDNFLEDGTVIKLDLPYFKAMEGLTQAEADQLDVTELVEIIPAAA